jgi:hypothetical protein
MLTNGNPNDNLLKDDRYHLHDKGISLLASNIKRVIHAAVGIPLPFVRNQIGPFGCCLTDDLK